MVWNRGGSLPCPMDVRRKVKRVVLPRGRKVRRLPAGIGRGLRMDIGFHDGQTQMWAGLYEAQLNRHLRAIARPGYRSFDLGGADGYDALVLVKLTGGEVVTVESEAPSVEGLRRNVAANPGLPPITVVHGFVAASDGDGTVSIDGLADAHFMPDLVKLDIEGGEVDALRGAKRVLAERRPALLLEVHGYDLEWECLAILRDAGYRPPTVVDRRRWLPEHRPLEHNRWLIFPG